MMEISFTANFGVKKAGLSSVKWAWLADDGSIIGIWMDVAGELVPDTGIYYIFEDPSSNAYWLAWWTNDGPDAARLVTGIQAIALTFNFGVQHSGKSIGYQFRKSDGTLIASEITADILEFENSGVYLAKDVILPALAEFVQARTIEAEPYWLGGALVRPEIFGNLMSPVDGAYMEEV